MESLSRTDQALVAGVAVAMCLLVMLSLRGTRPGAPARMGAIVAGIVMLLALMVGLRAHDLTNPRSDDKQAPAALRPKNAQPYGGAVLSGDPQTGLRVSALSDATSSTTTSPAPSSGATGPTPADPSPAGPNPGSPAPSGAASGSPAPSSPAASDPAASGPNPSAPGGRTADDSALRPGAYISDARFCDGRLEAGVRLGDVEPPDAGASPSTSPPAATSVAAVDSAPSGWMLGVRAGSDPAEPSALSIVYTPDDGQVRVITADGATAGTLASAATEPAVKVEFHGTGAEVWFDGQKISSDAVAVTAGCGAVRFSTWGVGAELHDLVIRPAE